MKTDLLSALTDETLSETYSYKKILVPVDMQHSQACLKAIEMAAQLTRLFKAQTSILTVAPPLEDVIAQMPEDHKSEFVYFVRRLSKLHGVKFTPVFTSHESPKKVILDSAKELDIDLIVMASHEPKKLDHLFRSNASNIAKHFAGSVFVVR